MNTHNSNFNQHLLPFHTHISPSLFWIEHIPKASQIRKHEQQPRGRQARPGCQLLHRPIRGEVGDQVHGRPGAADRPPPQPAGRRMDRAGAVPQPAAPLPLLFSCGEAAARR